MRYLLKSFKFSSLGEVLLQTHKSNVHFLQHYMLYTLTLFCKDAQRYAEDRMVCCIVIEKS